MSGSEQTIDRIEGEQDCRGDHCPFDGDVIEPIPRERRLGLLHRTASFAPSGFSIVVLASHSPPQRIELRCCGTNPRRRKNSCALSLTSALNRRAPRAAASLSSASTSIVPTPCPAPAGCT